MKKQIIIAIFLMAFGLLSLLYCLTYISFGLAINFGLIFIAFVGAYIFLEGFCKINKHSAFNRKIFIKIRKVIAIGLIAIIIPLMIMEGLIIYNSKSDRSIDVKYLIVLGAGLHGDKISRALQERLNSSIEYVSRFQSTKLILSGGKGQGELITEASAMEKYLVTKGIPKNQLIIENKSTSTYENIKFSKTIINRIDRVDSVKIGIVTNDFHMYRAKFIAKRQGINAYGISAKTPISIIPVSYIREGFAIIKSLIFD